MRRRERERQAEHAKLVRSNVRYASARACFKCARKHTTGTRMARPTRPGVMLNKNVNDLITYGTNMQIKLQIRQMRLMGKWHFPFT